MPKRDERIVVRHEYTGSDDEDIQVGLRVWATFIAERLRQHMRNPVGNKTEEKPA